MASQLGFDTLAAAQRQVQEGLDVGVTCPCCGQLARRYRRPLTSTMAAGLIVLCRLTDGDTEAFVNVRRINAELRALKTSNPTSDFSKLAWWKFIEGKPAADSRKRSSGLWRITDRGVRFVRGDGVVTPAKAIVYDNEVEGWTDETITIRDALGTRFDYAALMRPPEAT